MKKIIQKIIIILFERYAFDYWVDIQAHKEEQRLLRKYETDDIEYAKQCVIDEPIREAYRQGCADGADMPYYPSL